MKTKRDQDEQAGIAGSDDNGLPRFIAQLYGVEGAVEAGIGFVHWPDAILMAVLYWALAVCLFAAMWAHWPKK